MRRLCNKSNGHLGCQPGSPIDPCFFVSGIWLSDWLWTIAPLYATLSHKSFMSLFNQILRSSLCIHTQRSLIIAWLFNFLTGSKSSFWLSWYHLWSLPGTILDFLWGHTHWQGHNKDASSGKNWGLFIFVSVVGHPFREVWFETVKSMYFHLTFTVPPDPQEYKWVLIEKWILSHFQGHVIWICFNFYYYYYHYYYCYYYYYYYYYSQDVLYFIFQKTFVILAFSKNYVEAVLSYVG